ncbi:unnamed protein product [Rhizophagus irregularis]|nr:unnamed protein product [Rhizophagus irregularis]CAB5186584.1 unnamed protein product [Rhizophagus irregularis]
MLNDNSSKNIAEGIIEQISDADNFNWRFHDERYSAKNNQEINFRYKCSQRSDCAKKLWKCFNPEKQCDTLPMKRFDCHGEINIVIDLEMKITSVNVIHKILHELPKEIGVPNCVKDFISENIDLLPKEIYARLVENGLDPEICQNQIYFWWSKLGEIRYKRDSNTFLSAKVLLEEYNCMKILEVDFPVQAIAFEIGLYQMLIKIIF